MSIPMQPPMPPDSGMVPPNGPPQGAPPGAMPPPPNGGAPGNAVNGTPDPAVLIPQLAQAVGVPPEQIVAALKTLPPDMLNQFLTMPFDIEVQLLVQLFRGGNAGGPPPAPAAGMPPPPPPPPLPPPGGPLPPPPMPQGPPPGMEMGPPPGALPPGGGSGAPLSPSAMTAPPPPPLPAELVSKEEAVGMAGAPKARKVEPPKLKPLASIKAKSRWGTSAPDLAYLRDLAARARNLYAGRDQDIDADWEMYHLISRAMQLDSTATEPLKGELWHTWNKPAVIVDQVVGAVQPDVHRLLIQNDPWDDTYETLEAAQHIENYYRTQLARCYRSWAQQGNLGNHVPGFARMVAICAVVEGSVGRRYYTDPDEDGVFFMEPVPIRQLYTIDGWVLRILEMSLREARAAYRDIDKLWPKVKKANSNTRQSAYPSDDEQVAIVVACDKDGLWECMFWEFSAPNDDWYENSKNKEDKQWIKKTALNTGVCPLQYPPLWFGSAMSGKSSRPVENTGILHHTPAGGNEQMRLRHRGLLTPLREQVKLGSQLISIVATSANYVTNPPMVHKVNPQNPPDFFDSDGQSKRIRPSRALGAVSQIYVDEAFEPVPVSPEGVQSLQALLNLVMTQVGDVAQPVLSGGGDFSSGADRYVGQNTASDHVIKPLREFFVEWYELALEELGTIAWRKGKGKSSALYTSLPYRAAGRTPIKSAGRPANGMGGAVLASDFDRNGAVCRVRYRMDDPVKLQQLVNAWITMLKEGVVDMYMVRDELQIEDALQMDRRVMRDQALGDESVKKARIGRALLQGGDLTMAHLYFQERLLERDKANQGSAPAPPGIASAPAQGNQPMPPPAAGA